MKYILTLTALIGLIVGPQLGVALLTIVGGAALGILCGMAD